MLSDRTIRKLMEKQELLIDPIEDRQIQPASVDLRLGGLCHRDGYPLIFFEHEAFPLEPRRFLLGGTIETVGLCRNLVGRVEGKSTRARQGLIVHAAGFVDPGFRGQLTLEMFNMGDEPIFLEYGMLICQIAFNWMDTTPDRAYGHPDLGSHYQGQTGPTPARLT